MKTIRLALRLLLLTLFLHGGSAFAAFTVNMYPSGGNVLAVGSGSFNLAGATPAGTGSGTVQVLPGAAIIALGGSTNFDQYQLTGGPGSIAPFGATPATSGTGGFVGVNSGTFFEVPPGYVSGTTFTSTATWSGATLASLHMPVGTYTWTWGAGVNADSFTLIVSAAPPASVPTLGRGGIALLALGLLAVTALMMRRPRS